MCAVAEWPVGRLFTVTEPDVFCFGSHILDWPVFGHSLYHVCGPKHFVCAVTKRLTIAVAACAQRIGFAFFNLKLERLAFIHSALV